MSNLMNFNAFNNLYSFLNRIRQKLIDNNYAAPYTKHMKLLTELFLENNIRVATDAQEEAPDLENDCSHLLYDFKFDKSDISYAYLDNSDNMVEVSVIENPSRLYLRNVSSNSSLETLNRTIKTHFEKIKLFKNNLDNIKYVRRAERLQSNMSRKLLDCFQSKHFDMYCLAKLQKEDAYYRAKILDFKELSEDINDDEITVFFVDYGNCDKVKRVDIFPLNHQFLECPFQSVECALDGIVPLKQRKWSVQSQEALWHLTHLENGVHRKTKAILTSESSQIDRVHDSENFDQVIQRRCVIKLMTECYQDYIDVSHKLVEMRLARLTQKEEKSLFGLTLFNESNNKLSDLAEICLESFIRFA